MPQAKAGSEQSRLHVLAEVIEILNRYPELVGPHVELLDRVEKIREDSMHNLFGTRIAFLRCHPTDDFKKFLDLIGLCEFLFHGYLLPDVVRLYRVVPT